MIDELEIVCLTHITKCQNGHQWSYDIQCEISFGISALQISTMLLLVIVPYTGSIHTEYFGKHSCQSDHNATVGKHYLRRDANKQRRKILRSKRLEFIKYKSD